MTWLKSILFSILLISLIVNCTEAKTGILGIIGQIDPKVQAVKFWADLLIPELFGDDTPKKILSEVQAVSGQISQMRVHLDQRLDVMIKTIPARVQADARVDQSIKTIEDEINHIDNLYNTQLARLLKEPDNLLIQNDLVNKVLVANPDVTASVNKIYRVIIKDRTLALSDDFLTQVQTQLQLISDDRCDSFVSPHLWLYDIYMNILITEVRAFVLNTIASSIKAKSEGASYDNIINMLTEELSNRLVQYARAIRPRMAVLPRDIRRCDPVQHKRGETFIEFEKLLQPIIINEDQFGANTVCSWCRHARKIEGKELILRKQHRDLTYPVNRKCNGTVYGCLTYGNVFAREGQVCLLPENSIRRYGWIHSNRNNSDFGDASKCDGEIKELDPHQHYGEYHPSLMPGINPPRGFNFCPYCLCICAEINPFTVTRAIDITETYTNIAQNMVIVGIQIVENRRMIHLRVKQGKLLPGGRIDPNSLSWKPIKDMDVASMQKVTRFAGYTNWEKLVEHKDYVTIDKYEYNLVLEEMMAEKNSIIFGVRFQPFNETSLKGIKLQIATARFNWTTAKIDTDYKWRPLSSSDPLREANRNPGVIQVMENLDEPSKSSINKPSLKNKVIRFTMSSMAKDAGQSMVPYFDSLPVETIPAAPLGGIGLFHKAYPGFGGFISPRVYNLDLTDHIPINAH